MVYDCIQYSGQSTIRPLNVLFFYVVGVVAFPFVWILNAGFKVHWILEELLP
jgi:hypothetical protein